MGKYPIDVSKVNYSFLSASAHKFHGPKGCGFIYINGNNITKPFLDGGGQERTMRSGTENIQGMAGLAKALELCYQGMASRKEHIKSIRSYLKSKLQEQFQDIDFLGDQNEAYLYTVLNVSLPLNPKTGLISYTIENYLESHPDLVK